MNSKVTIDIEEVQQAVNILLDHLRGGGIRQLDLGSDYHWEMRNDKRYDVTTDPTDFSIGSLFDDLESIRDLTTGKSEPVVLLLANASNLLLYIAETVTEAQLSSKPDRK